MNKHSKPAVVPDWREWNDRQDFDCHHRGPFPSHFDELMNALLESIGAIFIILTLYILWLLAAASLPGGI